MNYTVVDVEPDTPEWLEERRASIGASEAGGLVRESHYGNTPLSIYLRKIGVARDTFPKVKSIVTHRAEPIMDEVFRELHPELGDPRPGFMARRPDAPWVHATFDRLLDGPSGEIPLQYKTAHPFTRQDWEQGPIPDYLAQEDVECFILDAPYAYLFVWFWGSDPDDFHLFKLHARADRQAEIVDRARVLMVEHVARRVPPTASFGDDLAALYPAVAGRVVRADADTLVAVEALRETAAIRRAAVAEWTATENDMKFQIEQFMRDATELVNPYTNNLIHTWRVDKNGNRRHFSPKTKDFAA